MVGNAHPTVFLGGLSFYSLAVFAFSLGIDQGLGKLTDLHALGISLAQVACEGPLVLLIEKHRIKRACANTGLAAGAKPRVDLNGARL